MPVSTLDEVTTTRPRADFRLRSVAVPAYGPTILEGIGYGASIPIVPLLARQLGATVGQAALVAGLLGVGQLCASLPAGALIARIGERRAMIIASLGGVATAAVSGTAMSVAILGVAAFVTGMTWSVFLLARQGFMIDAVPEHLRARALSTLGGSHRIGMVIGPVVGTAVIHQWGIRAAFAVGVLASLSALLLVLRVADLGHEARALGRADPATTWAVLRRHTRTLATLGTSVMAISGLRAVRLSVLPLWGEHIGLTPSQISFVFAIGALVEVAIFYPAGWVMDRRGRALVAVPCAGLLAGGFLLLPLTASLTAMLLVTVLMAIGNGLGSGIVMTLGADTAPVVHRAKYLGGWRLCGDIGSSGGPLVVSAVVAAAGLASASVLVGGMALAGTAWIAYWVNALDRRRR